MQKDLTINDRIYGPVNITEHVLLELIESPPLQRLKGISQFGLPQRLYHYPGFSRYEHSLGVMVLLRKLGASLEEQSAGLIHDVSHTAFSHLIDWVIGDRVKEDHQDRNLQRVISLSRIPEILRENGMDLDKVTDVDQYRLLEMPAPDLCADRIDYALREFHTWASPEIVQQCIEDLVNYQGRIVFGTKNIAEKFAGAYGKCQAEHWGGAECMVRYELLSGALKSALEIGLIELSDFYMEDEPLIEKLREGGNDKIKKVLTFLERPKLNLQEDEANPQFEIIKKFRYIDPVYRERGSLHRLSETDLSYRKFLEEQRGINKRGIKVRLID